MVLIFHPRDLLTRQLRRHVSVCFLSVPMKTSPRSQPLCPDPSLLAAWRLVIWYEKGNEFNSTIGWGYFLGQLWEIYSLRLYLEAAVSRTTVFVFLCIVSAVNILTRSSHRKVSPLAKGKGPGYISICFPIKTKIFSYEHNQEKALLTPGKTAPYTEALCVGATFALGRRWGNTVKLSNWCMQPDMPRWWGCGEIPFCDDQGESSWGKFYLRQRI